MLKKITEEEVMIGRTFIYAYIRTHIYNADLHGHGTAVVNKSVGKQSGHVFVGIFFFLYPHLSDYAWRSERNDFFFFFSLFFFLEICYHLGSMLSASGVFVDIGTTFSLSSFLSVPCPLFFFFFFFAYSSLI